MAMKPGELAQDVILCEHTGLLYRLFGTDGKHLGSQCANCNAAVSQVEPARAKRRQPKVESLVLPGVKL